MIIRSAHWVLRIQGMGLGPGCVFDREQMGESNRPRESSGSSYFAKKAFLSFFRDGDIDG